MAFKPGKVIINTLRYNEVIDFKDKRFFPEYTSILEDTTTEEDIKVKNKKDAKVYWSKILQYKFVKSDPEKMFQVSLQ